MKLGIVGCGVVGQAMTRCFMEHAEVHCYDVIKDRATHPLREVVACDVVMVCLPTPQKPDSCEMDLSAVENFFAGQAGSLAHFALRSTVPVGTTARLTATYRLPNLVHSPEFLTARCAITDAQLPARNIIGHPPDGAVASGRLAGLYATRFPGVPIYHMTSDESEAVKLFQNSFFAAKIAFWNECRTLADHLGLDWERVLAAVLADGRISHSHCKVPGPDGRFGYSGSCIPKDSSCLLHQMRSYNLPAPVLYGAVERNKLDRARPTE